MVHKYTCLDTNVFDCSVYVQIVRIKDWILDLLMRLTNLENKNDIYCAFTWSN